MDKNLKIVLGSLLILLIGWFVNTNYLAKPALITVTGEGKVKVAPSMVKFTVIILNLSPSATQAITDNNKLVKQLTTLLKGEGVIDSDINLAYVRVIPPQTTLGQTNYQAVNSADITLRNITKFDNLVLQLYNLGVNSVSNILFTTENSKDLEKEAVAQAINEAKLRGEEIAKTSGKRLGRMVSLSTVEAGEASALSGETGSSTLGGTATSSPSQIEIKRQAAIVFEIK